ncbi:MAG TPA: tetratricopeptide repeat protein [Geothrix sp.]|jgi:tetratricopeptide (TPR) repeat protein
MSLRSHLVPVLACLLAVGQGVAAEPPGDTTLFRRYIALDGAVQRAGREVAARRFEEAQRLLEPCLTQVPDHFEAHYLLARMAYEARDFTGALVHVERSERSLADLDHRYREEMAALKAEAEAEEVATRASLDYLYARGADPGSCSAILFQVKRNALEFLEAKKGHLNDRENPFGVPADYRFLHGNCLYRLGRRAEALGQYRLAVEQDRAHANAWNNLISLQWEAKAYAQAHADLVRAETLRISIRPDLKKAVLEAAAAVSSGTGQAGAPPALVDPH